jgi:hypothetical protein
LPFNEDIVVSVLLQKNTKAFKQHRRIRETSRDDDRRPGVLVFRGPEDGQRRVRDVPHQKPWPTGNQRPARGGRLNLSFDRLLLDDGSTVDLSARIVQVHEDFGSGGTVKQGAIGAAIGGILGKVIGGTKGAIVGVLLGGAGGAISSTGDDVELPAGTVFTLQLERETTVPQR